NDHRTQLLAGRSCFGIAAQAQRQIEYAAVLGRGEASHESAFDDPVLSSVRARASWIGWIDVDGRRSAPRRDLVELGHENPQLLSLIALHGARDVGLETSIVAVVDEESDLLKFEDPFLLEPVRSLKLIDVGHLAVRRVDETDVAYFRQDRRV